MIFIINGWNAPVWMATAIVLFIVGMFGYGIMSAIQDVIHLLSKKK